MNGQGLGQLLAEAVQESERRAPLHDPVAALASARRRAACRRGHVVVLSFVVFAFVLQALPSEALGSSPRPVVTAASDTEPAVQAQAAETRLVPAGERG
jgi:hypothetical protein